MVLKRFLLLIHFTVNLLNSLLLLLNIRYLSMYLQQMTYAHFTNNNKLN